jgi:Arc/MetJ family transcription regulator
MRTTLDIDNQLLQEVSDLSRQKTRSSAVEVALKEYVRLRRKEQLLSMSGRVWIEENWRSLREAEHLERAGPD